MLIEYNILKYFIDNKYNYNKYYNYLNIDYIKDNYKEVYKLLKVVDNYYNKNPEKDSISILDLEISYINNYPVMKDGDKALLSSLLQSIHSCHNTDSIVQYLTTQRNRALAGELAIIALDVADGKKPMEALDSVYQKIEQEYVEKENQYVSTSLSTLYNQQVHTPGLRWRLNWLNQSLGSLRKGDFGFVFARPETGKTTFLASEVTQFALQATLPILWCNNEEGGSKVMLRCIQATLNCTNSELFSDIEGNEARYNSLIGDRIHIYDDAGMTMHSIEARCKDLNPSMIILDQIDKIKGIQNDRYDLQMKGIYQWARELAKRYGAVLGVCQAGSTGEGKKWLNMNDVDSSHTAKQGEADWILGIGKSNDEGMSGVRFLNISKNKLIGDEDTLNEFRHGKAEVLIDAERARYKSL